MASSVWTIIRRALIDWWDAWIALMILNLAWAFCWITVILGPPATFALYYAANQIAHGRSYEYKELIQVGRQYFFKSWLWAILNLIVLMGLIVNIQFYAQMQSALSVPLAELCAFLVVIWLMIQGYTLPYLIEQSDKRLRIALKNALFTFLKNPLYTLILALFSGLVLIVCLATVVMTFLGGPCLIAILGNRAVLDRLEAFGIRQPRNPSETPPA